MKKKMDEVGIEQCFFLKNGNSMPRKYDFGMLNR